MTANARIPPRVVGCDVGKHTVVAFDSASGYTRQLNNTFESLSAFLGALTGECLVICEATGGYEATLLLAAAAAGVPAHRADARKIKAFIRSLGTLGKASTPAASPPTAWSVMPSCRGGPPARARSPTCRPSSANSSASAPACAAS